MRISDWSSDVCSSDLGDGDVTNIVHRLCHRQADRNGALYQCAGCCRVTRAAIGPEHQCWPNSRAGDRKSGGEGQSVSVRVDPGGSRNIKKKTVQEFTECSI